MAAALRLPGVDGAAPGISESVAVQDTTSRANEPQVTLFATDPRSMSGLGEITGESGEAARPGRPASVRDLSSTSTRPTTSTHRRATACTSSPRGRASPAHGGRHRPLRRRGDRRWCTAHALASAQRILGVGARVQHVLVSNDGDEVSGADRTAEVSGPLQATSSSWDSRSSRSRRTAWSRRITQGATYLSLFSTFGTFTISAGILLIFLVFVMLAAERRGEMGTARAIGTQRRHLVQMFLFEGAAYDVLAAVVGAVLGLGLAVAMVRLIAGALADAGLVTIRYHLTWTSLVVAFSLGALLTLAVVSSPHGASAGSTSWPRSATCPSRRSAGAAGPTGCSPQPAWSAVQAWSRLRIPRRARRRSSSAGR